MMRQHLIISCIILILTILIVQGDLQGAKRRSAPSVKAGKGKILFVVSNAHFYGASKIKTGNHFGEIVSVYDIFKKKGYAVDFVSPEGGAVALAYINMSDPLQKKYIYDHHFMDQLEHTNTPGEIEAAGYTAIYYPGGGAAMFGVPENEEIQQIAMDIYNAKGVVSAVCHGTAGIVHLKKADGKYLVSGKAVNGYPEEHENQNAAYFKEFPFLIKKTVEDHGGHFNYSERGQPHMEVAGRLVTGQNPASTKMLAGKVVELLENMTVYPGK